MGREQRRIQAPAGDELQELRGRERVDQAGRHGDVADPLLFEVEGRGTPVDADVGDVPTGAHEVDGELERLGDADRLDGDIGAKSVGELHHRRHRILRAVVHGHVGAEPARGLEPAVGEVDRDDVPGREQLRRQDRGQPDRARADDGDDVARPRHAVEDSDLEGRRQDVREEQHLLVREPVGDLVHRVVGERNARVLGLQAVDQMAEDPAAAAQALAVAGLLAVPAAPARADAREEHAVAGGERADSATDLLDGADRLVAEHRARETRGHVALEDVQVGAADRRGVDADDRVARIGDRGIVDGVPAPFSGAVVDEGLHRVLRSAAVSNAVCSGIASCTPVDHGRPLQHIRRKPRVAPLVRSTLPCRPPSTRVIRTKAIPALVILLSLAAIGVTTLLQARADAGRDAQLKLEKLESELTQLQNAPFKASPRTGGSPAFAGKLMDNGKRRIAVTLAELRHSSPVPALARIPGPLKANYAALDEIFAIGASGADYGRRADRAVGHRRQGDGRHHERARRGRRRVRPRRIGDAVPFQDRLQAGDPAARAGVRVLLSPCRAARRRQLQRGPHRLAHRAPQPPRAGGRTSRPQLPRAGGDRQVALALFDLDGFKEYNDTFGHPSGDALLTRLGERLADRGRRDRHRLPHGR